MNQVQFNIIKRLLHVKTVVGDIIKQIQVKRNATYVQEDINVHIKIKILSNVSLVHINIIKRLPHVKIVIKVIHQMLEEQNALKLKKFK